MKKIRRITETFLSPAVRLLNNNIALLLERCRRFIVVDRGSDPVLWITFFESIIVQLRALICENKSNIEKNYTVQGVLGRLGCDELRERFNAFLDIKIGSDRNGCRYSYREAIKNIADKFICHYDNQDVTECQDAVPVEIYCDLIDMLNAEVIERLVSRVFEIIHQALEKNENDFKHELICHLFGSQENYERVLKIQCPRAD